MKQNLKVAIIGTGKVGTALALDFSRKKIKVLALIDKDLKKARSLASKIKAKVFSSELSDIPENVNLFVIAVQDRFIPEVTKNLSDTFSDFKGKYAFHTSGALTSEDLNPLEEKGCLVFSLHPNFSFALNQLPGQKLISFNECVFAIESESKKAISVAKKICNELGYKFIKIETSQKTLYHIFSVIISNYTVTKFYQIEKYFGKKAINSYLNLLKSTIQNIEELGVKESLTGPIIRQDIPTIQKHLQMLSTIDMNLKEIYAKCGKLTIEMIENELEPDTLIDLKRIFTE